MSIWKDVFQINPINAALETDAHLELLANGNVLATYVYGGKTYARVLDSLGEPVSGEFQITPTNSLTYSQVDVYADPNGGFWRVAKTETGGGGGANRPALPGEALELQKFTDAGGLASGTISISLDTASAQVDDVQVAVTNGQGIVVWTETVSGNEDIKFRLFNSDTGALGAVQTISAPDTVHSIDVEAIGGSFYIASVDGVSGSSTDTLTLTTVGATTQNSVTRNLTTTGAGEVSIGIHEDPVTGQVSGIIGVDDTNGGGTTSFVRYDGSSLTSVGGLNNSLTMQKMLYVPAPSSGSVDMFVSIEISSGNLASAYAYRASDGASLSASGAFATGVISSMDATVLDDGRIQMIWTDSTNEVQSAILDFRAAANDEAGPSGLIVGTTFDDTIVGTGDADEIIGHDGADTINGNGGNDILSGGLGIDTIKGNGGNDLIRGGDQADVLEGGGGVDTIYGDADADIIRGGANADTLFGGAGSDTIRGNSGNDIIRGEDDGDTLSGDGGRDVLYGGDGADTIRGNNGWDRLFGDQGADTLIGGDGDDILLGGSEDDQLRGNVGKDILRGEAGEDDLLGGGWEDFLDGGTDDDNLWGGSGRDFFYFSAGYGEDTIKDWEDNLDEIRLDDALWTGVLSAQDVVDNYGTVLSGNAVLSFDNGESLIVEGVTNLQTLVDDITIV